MTLADMSANATFYRFFKLVIERFSLPNIAGVAVSQCGLHRPTTRLPFFLNQSMRYLI
jgi:hypothetical protein